MTQHLPASPSAPPPAPAARTFVSRALLVYVLIGGLSFVIDAGLLYVLTTFESMPVLLAGTIAYWTGVLVNFTLNRRTMAVGRGGLRRQTIRYAVLLAGNYLFTLAVLSAGTAIGAPVVVAKGIAVILCTGVNFVLYRRWVFS
jgi:putative flippase GtrA